MSDQAIGNVGCDNLPVEAMHFGYGNALPIFEGLGIEVKPSEFLAILGPSGCGKTALLNLL